MGKYRRWQSFSFVFFIVVTASVLAAAITAGTASFSYAQSLPQFPPDDDAAAPPLTQEDIIPEKPAEGEKLPKFDDQKNPAKRKAEELDKLFKRLKFTADINEAAKINRQIQGLWAQSGSETVDLLMEWAENAVRNEDYTQAMDFLDNVVALDPGYGEGWMRRASVHIQMNDVALAMVELNEVLKREPRHYNAIAQLGAVLEMTERKELALDAYMKALEYYPQFTRIQKRVGELLEEKTDRAI